MFASSNSRPPASCNGRTPANCRNWPASCACPNDTLAALKEAREKIDQAIVKQDEIKQESSSKKKR